MTMVSECSHARTMAINTRAVVCHSPIVPRTIDALLRVGMQHFVHRHLIAHSCVAANSQPSIKRLRPTNKTFTLNSNFLSTSYLGIHDYRIIHCKHVECWLIDQIRVTKTSEHIAHGVLFTINVFTSNNQQTLIVIARTIVWIRQHCNYRSVVDWHNSRPFKITQSNKQKEKRKRNCIYEKLACKALRVTIP